MLSVQRNHCSSKCNQCRHDVNVISIKKKTRMNTYSTDLTKTLIRKENKKKNTFFSETETDRRDVKTIWQHIRTVKYNTT